MRGQRFTVQDNGCGGFQVWDRQTSQTAGGECSHKSNALIIASRLNGFRDTVEPLSFWFRYYRVKP